MSTVILSNLLSRDLKDPCRSLVLPELKSWFTIDFMFFPAVLCFMNTKIKNLYKLVVKSFFSELQR